jgi:hypothetical protein
MRRWIAVGLVAAALGSAACKEAIEDETAGYEPAKLVAAEGSRTSTIVLTRDAAERIDLQTVPVEVSGRERLTVVPHAAVFYGVDGETWTYTSVEPLTFVREPITVDRIDGDRAYLSKGPPPGTSVVTVGATELFGVEAEIAG